MQRRKSLLNSFTTNLFGAIAGGSTVLGRQSANIDFIPKVYSLDKPETINISGKGQNATWLGLRLPIMQKYAYEFCFPVASVCDKLAEMDTNGQLKIIRKGGKGANDEATNAYSNSMRRLLEQ